MANARVLVGGIWTGFKAAGSGGIQRTWYAASTSNDELAVLCEHTDGVALAEPCHTFFRP